jgi:hypothetical protein
MKCGKCPKAVPFKPPGWIPQEHKDVISSDFPNAFTCQKDGKLKDGDHICDHIVLLIERRVDDGEWADQFIVYVFKYPDGSTIEVSLNTVPEEGQDVPDDWQVLAEGAVDYQGDLKGLLERYPELKEHLS